MECPYVLAYPCCHHTLYCAPVEESFQPMSMLMCQLTAQILLNPMRDCLSSYFMKRKLPRSDTAMHSDSTSLQIAVAAAAPVQGSVNETVRGGAGNVRRQPRLYQYSKNGYSKSITQSILPRFAPHPVLMKPSFPHPHFPFMSQLII